MLFINTTKNSVNLYDVNKIIPYLENKSQFIDTDVIKRSDLFQKMCICGKFKIIEINESHIEKNLFILQNNLLNSFENLKNIKITYRGNVESFSGFSKHNRNIIYGLTKYGFDLTLIPISKIEGINAAESFRLNNLIKIPDSNSILINSSIPTQAINPEEYKYSIIYTTIESETIPQQYIEILKKYNEIWVTSDFNKKVLEKYKLTSTVFPCPINNKIFYKKQTQITFSQKLNKFVFLSIFGWNKRKGYDALLKAYIEEFSSEDPVSLLILTPYQDLNKKDQVYQMIKKTINEIKPNKYPDINRIGHLIDDNSLNDLYNSCNCFILPTRGEGFGIPFCEASLCNLPIISTNFSGQTMFLNKDNSNLVEIDSLITDTNEIHYWNNEVFPDLTSKEFINNLRKTIRYVYENENICKEKNNILKNYIIENFNQNIICGNMAYYLNKLWNQL